MIPTLSSSSYGAKGYRVPKHFRTVPFVILFVGQSALFVIVKLIYQFEGCDANQPLLSTIRIVSIIAKLTFRVTCDECSASEQVCMFRHAMRFREYPRFGDNLFRIIALLSEKLVLWFKQSRDCEAHFQWILNNIDGDGSSTTSRFS